MEGDRQEEQASPEGPHPGQGPPAGPGARDRQEGSGTKYRQEGSGTRDLQGESKGVGGRACGGTTGGPGPSPASLA